MTPPLSPAARSTRPLVAAGAHAYAATATAPLLARELMRDLVRDLVRTIAAGRAAGQAAGQATGQAGRAHTPGRGDPGSGRRARRRAAGTSWDEVVGLAGGVTRATGELLGEAGRTLRALRSLVHHLEAALDAGLVAEVRQGLADVGTAVDLMATLSAQLDQALPVLDATAPTLGMVNGTLAQLDATVRQVEALPAVRMARRLVRVPGGPMIEA